MRIVVGLGIRLASYSCKFSEYGYLPFRNDMIGYLSIQRFISCSDKKRIWVLRFSGKNTNIEYEMIMNPFPLVSRMCMISMGLPWPIYIVGQTWKHSHSWQQDVCPSYPTPSTSRQTLLMVSKVAREGGGGWKVDPVWSNFQSCLPPGQLSGCLQKSALASPSGRSKQCPEEAKILRWYFKVLLCALIT